ncbi:MULTISPECIES: hypothetical protein [unclassified Phaeobacter]|uniref:hypothetical protein n=1 Tax=unclassified Phaeobacter TaxID=2621772 RepID=UPI003A86053C
MTTSTLRHDLFAQPSTPAAAELHTGDLHAGDGVEMFSSGSTCREGDGNLGAGAGTALFSSGSAPQADGATTTGAATGLFSSGS